MTTENKGLLFIPDISGFTRFINELEIEHSSLIIQELLEVLINSNNLGLEISEIEGDAILFYKFGESPRLSSIYSQVEKMFQDFHRQIIQYDNRRYCQCAACSSAINLTLKIITHYGEFTGYNVKSFNKLIGRDVIVAHQLLKNDIPQHEYWLVTDNLSHNMVPAGLAAWMKWQSSVKKTEDYDIPFHYTQLGPLKDEIIPEPMPPLDLSNNVKVISLTEDYDTDIIKLFHAVGDFRYRHRWQEGVKIVEEVGHFLPRLGTRSRCIFEDGQEIIYAASYSYTPEKIEFSETDGDNSHVTYYTLEKKDEYTSQLTIDYYLTKGTAGEIKSKLFDEQKTEDMFRKSMQNLKQLVKEDLWTTYRRN
jgi:hypothetical protein